MFDYAMMYIKRAHAAMGTTRYVFLKNRAKSLIKKVDNIEEQERLSQYLENQLETAELDFTFQPFVEKVYWEKRGGSAPTFLGVEQRVEMQRGIHSDNRNMLRIIRNILALHGEIQQAEKAILPDLAFIWSKYQIIEDLEAEFMKLHSAVAGDLVELGDFSSKDQLIFNLIAPFFYLSCEYSYAHAHKFFPKINLIEKNVSPHSVVILADVLSCDRTTSLTEENHILLIHHVRGIYRSSPELFEYLGDIAKNYKLNLPKNLCAVFNYVRAQAVARKKDMLHSILALSLHETPPFDDVAKEFMRGFCEADLMGFYQEFIQPFYANPEEPMQFIFPWSVFETYKEMNTVVANDKIWDCLKNHQTINFKNVQGVFLTLDELKHFYSHVLAKKPSDRERKILIYYTYHAFSNIGIEPDCAFVKEVHEQYHLTFENVQTRFFQNPMPSEHPGELSPSRNSPPDPYKP